MVMFHHQLEKHHHLMEALLVLWGGGELVRRGGAWAWTGLIPGRG